MPIIGLRFVLVGGAMLSGKSLAMSSFAHRYIRFSEEYG
jgi:hypothetical protein